MVNESECKILPSAQGIPMRNILCYHSIAQSSTNSIAEFTIGIDLRRYRILYNPYKNEIISIKDITNNRDGVPVTSEIISQIEQMFFPDKAQIAEQFKNIMNRINDL